MLGAGMDSFLLANSNGVINGIGGIFVFFAGLTVLFIFAKGYMIIEMLNKTETQLKTA